MTVFADRVVYERTENGVDVYLLPVRENDVVVSHLYLPGGYAAAYELQVCVDVLEQALPASTKKQLRRAFFEKLETLGADMTVQFDSGYCVVTTSSRRTVFPEAFKIVMTMLRDAAFPAREVEEALTQVRTALHHEREDTRSCARHMLLDSLYQKGHPHWSPSIAAREHGLAHVTSHMIRELWHTVRATTGAFLCVAGDVALPEMQRAVSDAVCLLPVQRTAPPEYSVARVVGRGGADTLHRVHDRMNIDTYLGIPLSLTRESDAFLPLSIGVGVLGGSATSRLFHALRTRESLTYGSYATLDGFQDGYPGHLIATAVFPRDVFLRGRAVLRDVVRVFAERGVTRKECVIKKEELIGRYVVGLSTTAGACGALAAAIRAGKTPTYLDEFPSRIMAVSHRDVQVAIANHVRYDFAITAAAGDVETTGL